MKAKNVAPILRQRYWDRSEGKTRPFKDLVMTGSLGGE